MRFVVNDCTRSACIHSQVVWKKAAYHADFINAKITDRPQFYEYEN